MWRGQLDGIWWIPADPENRVAGTLRTTEGGRLELATIGVFQGLEGLGIDHRPDLIVGATGQGKLVTLLRPVSVNWRLTAPGIPSSVYTVGVAIFGHLFDRLDDVVFDEVEIEYPLLLEWAGVSGISFTHHHDENQHVERVDLHYTFPEEVSAALDDVEISLSYQFKQSGDYRNHARISQTTRLRIRLPEPQSIDEVWSHYRYHLQNYFAFATGVAVHPETVIAKSPSAAKTREDDKSERRVPLDVWIASRPNTVKDRERFKDFMVFTLADLEGQWSASLSTWFKKADLLGPVFDLYFGVRYEPEAYLNSQFLSLIQALEVLDRRTSQDGKYLDEVRFSEIKTLLVPQLPADLEGEVAQVFKSRIGFMNEHGLRRRLRRLLEQSGPAIESIIPDPGAFVRAAADTRNFLTHYNPDLKEKVATNESLYWLVQQSQFLLEVRLLAEIGFKVGQVDALVRRNQRYLQLAQALGER